MDSWGTGLLEVRYHPLWLQNLKQEDFPLKTDLFTETFPGTGGKDEFKLRVAPLDPIHSLKIYKNGDWTELEEDKHYQVDYNQRKVILLENSVLHTGDSVNGNYRVAYTPYLVEDGLALAYKLQRKK